MIGISKIFSIIVVVFERKIKLFFSFWVGKTLFWRTDANEIPLASPRSFEPNLRVCFKFNSTKSVSNQDGIASIEQMLENHLVKPGTISQSLFFSLKTRLSFFYFNSFYLISLFCVCMSITKQIETIQKSYEEENKYDL